MGLTISLSLRIIKNNKEDTIQQHGARRNRNEIIYTYQINTDEYRKQR